MKKIKVLSVLFAVALTLGMTACNKKGSIEPNGFVDWVHDEGAWKTVNSSGFMNDEKHKPSNEDVKKIARAISMSPNLENSSECMCVVIKDKAQQENIVGANNAGDGTVTFLVFGDKSLSAKNADLQKKGYYHAGLASGYANLAAISLGYGTHFYTDVNSVGENGEDRISETYLKNKNYTYTASDNSTVNAYGNVNFVCAIVVGKVDGKVKGGIEDRRLHDNVIIADESNHDNLVRTLEERDGETMDGNNIRDLMTGEDNVNRIIGDENVDERESLGDKIEDGAIDIKDGAENLADKAKDGAENLMDKAKDRAEKFVEDGKVEGDNDGREQSSAEVEEDDSDDSDEDENSDRIEEGVNIGDPNIMPPPPDARRIVPYFFA